MSLAPLLDASPTIQAHAFLAFAAIVLGAMQFALPKGVLWHRSVGWTFAFAMLFVAGSSLFIHTINTWDIWSPIHLLSILTLVTVPLAVWRAHRHDVARHRAAMIAIYAFALVVAGFFTLYPGRIMHRVFFGG
jgi:uncharacterized membrane protein